MSYSFNSMNEVKREFKKRREEKPLFNYVMFEFIMSYREMNWVYWLKSLFLGCDVISFQIDRWKHENKSRTKAFYLSSPKNAPTNYIPATIIYFMKILSILTNQKIKTICLLHSKEVSRTHEKKSRKIRSKLYMIRFL